MAIGLAFQAFFKILFDRQAAEAVRTALDRSIADGPLVVPSPNTSAATGSVAQPPAAIRPTISARSDALTLLSTLQREARFLDLIGEPLDSFEDAQVGAAARQVIGDVRKTLDRMFAIEPIAADEEGTNVPIAKPSSPVRYHILGRNSQQATGGTLVHRGWKADHCQLPKWNGDHDDALILSPIEIDADGQ